jgi:uncharacterized DUF497 family protein
LDKAAVNIRKHKIRFEDAAEVFRDPLNVEEYDEEHSDEYEARYFKTGIINGREIITVSFTMRGELIRFFSARSADSEERSMYAEHAKRHIG